MFMANISYSKTEQRHGFHLVDPSPWPLTTSLSLLTMAVGGIMYVHTYQGGGFILFFGFSSLCASLFVWWRDVCREATFQGHHTSVVQTGLRYGMIMFIISEAMFFLAFFWAFLHSALAPSIWIGCIWPPAGIDVFSPWEIPLLNTVILLFSGLTVTWAHHAICAGQRREAILGLLSTICLGVLFTLIQTFEYVEASFTLSDGIYGSTFFMATGFHGFHVLLGTTMLFVMFMRQLDYQFSQQHHFGFLAATWYWHFVDVVWLLLFLIVYWWGGV
jgi:cytochrome c oxidase subunit 3